jgi:hypothetical protein
MRPLIGSIAGGGSAAAASLASWPLLVAVANTKLISAIGLPPPAGELLWGVSIGVLGGVVGTLVAGRASTRAWPTTAYGSWFSWSLLLMALTALQFVPVLFTLSAVLLAGVTAFTLSRVWRPTAVDRAQVFALPGMVGFALLIATIVALLVVAMQVRPNGATPEVWRAYMSTVNLAAIAAVVLCGLGALAVSAATSGRRVAGVVSLAMYASLVLVTTPFFGFLSACYAGEALSIFAWLGTPTC